MVFASALRLKLIYVFSIQDRSHEGCLKIGETTCKEDISAFLEPNSPALQEAAHARIKSFTQTAGIPYELLYTELAVFNQDGHLCAFSDKDVHKVLENSCIKRKVFNKVKGANEWFVTDLDTAKQAIAAVKNGQSVIQIPSNEQSNPKDEQPKIQSLPIVFRPEQDDAIKRTVAQFKRRGSKMLWNAKMRFGKTLTALQVVKKLGFDRTLILTHRPVVNDGWFEDFRKIFPLGSNYLYGSKFQGASLSELELSCDEKPGSKFIFFASMQDLRGSSLVGGNFDKNQELFNTKWDLIIIDEAHEGIKTELGNKVLENLFGEKTCALYLSGTPFNLQQDFDEKECFTWDYVMEQRAKAQWDSQHLGDHNPYAVLPRLKIFTYNLGDIAKEFISKQDRDVTFNFAEFFRIKENSQRFVHEEYVVKFLELLRTDSKSKKDECYPFACQDYRNIFRHSLWILPGVKAAAALCDLLRQDPVFKEYKILNVAGNGLNNEESDSALDLVKSAIGEYPEQTRTITVSCGRLTTGVSIPAWTGVLMLSGSEVTSATTYMQTIFRVQTPAVINGRVKDTCYVFDFAPDRALKVLADAAQVSTQAGKTTQDDRIVMEEFLNFCPIIAINGSQMHRLTVSKMMEQLKQVYAERVMCHGFEDRLLYNNTLLQNLDEADNSFLEHIDRILATSKKSAQKKDLVKINDQGLDPEDKKPEPPKKPHEKIDPTPEEEELKKRKEAHENAIRILRAVSIRMPLLIYGADLKNESQEITIENFESLIDDVSWAEFMPAGFTKEDFRQLKRYYDADIFCAAGKKIRALVKQADNLPVDRRIACITALFSTFRNPDKETVLTPWKLVNEHLGNCFGGFVFNTDNSQDLYDDPERDDDEFAAYAKVDFKSQDMITFDVFGGDSRILELNSKSGLYPLYMAYSIYRVKLRTENYSNLSLVRQQEVWDNVLSQNIFVICKSPMACAITKRTLAGFRKTRVNAQYYPDLVDALKDPDSNFFKDVVQGKSFWHANKERSMKFNAIVGNPPYQVKDNSGESNNSASSVYNHFVEGAIKLNPNYVSMIMPARWFNGGKGLDSFREHMFNDKRLRKIVDFVDSRDCFSNVDIAGGVCYFLWDRNYNGTCEFDQVKQGQHLISNRDLSQEFLRDAEAVDIVEKIRSHTPQDGFYDGRVCSRSPFGLSSTTKALPDGDITLISAKNSRGAFDSGQVSKNRDLIPLWKVIITHVTSEHAGQTDRNGQKRVLSSLQVIKPQEVCTDTYLVLDYFKTKEEGEFAVKYFSTRLVRLLISLQAFTHNLQRERFNLVPIPCYTKDSDIDWTKSVEDIEDQLNRKYGFTEADIGFINRTIKVMK